MSDLQPQLKKHHEDQPGKYMCPYRQSRIILFKGINSSKPGEKIQMWCHSASESLDGTNLLKSRVNEEGEVMGELCSNGYITDYFILMSMNQNYQAVPAFMQDSLWSNQ